MTLTIEFVGGRWKRVDNIEIDTTDNLYRVDEDYFIDCVKQNSDEYVAGKYVACFNDERVYFEVID